MPGRVELGYNTINSRRLCIDFSFIQGMFSEAFDNPNSAFYSCWTGADTTNMYGSSLAQNWVNRVGGRTWATYNRTDYGTMIVGESEQDKRNRNVYGFNINGSPRYPSASLGENSWMNYYRLGWYINY